MYFSQKVRGQKFEKISSIFLYAAKANILLMTIVSFWKMKSNEARNFSEFHPGSCILRILADTQHCTARFYALKYYFGPTGSKKIGILIVKNPLNQTVIYA